MRLGALVSLVKSGGFLRRWLRASTQTIVGGSDYRRWTDPRNLSADWDSRTKKIATFIQPGTSVIEFGAGRMVLKNFLPPSCTYSPSDLVDRGAGTFVCNLNAKMLPPFSNYQVAVLGGVLEYVNDVPRLASHLSNFMSEIIASYAVVDLDRNMEPNNRRSNRRAAGWVNDYSAEDIIRIFDHAGYLCVHSELWRSQKIFCFAKKQTP
jgi:hypothetical protein